MPGFLDSLHDLSSAFLQVVQKEIVFSTVLFVVVFLLTTVIRKKSPYLHYGLWALVLIRLLLPPDFSFDFSARSLFNRVEFKNLLQANEAIILSDESLPGVSQPSAAVVGETAAVPTSIDFFSIRSLPWETVLFLVWVIGVFAFAAVFFRRYLHYLRVVKRSRPVVGKEPLQLVAIWRSRFEITRNVSLLSSPDCLSPFTMGVLRPVIYLPDAMLKKADTETIEAVIAHELAHIRNWDDLWIRLQNLVQILYFFHPVVWLLNSKLNETRERICDELVLSHGSISPNAYGRSMLSVLKLNLFGVEGLEMLPSFGNHKKKFSQRILEITRISSVRKSNLLAVVLMVSALAVFLLPMAESSDQIPGEQIVQLRRMTNGSSDYKMHLDGAGSAFKCIQSADDGESAFCPSKLPSHLKNMEYAAVGIFDNDYRKFWVLKGINEKGSTEFYLDSNGDDSFTDEKPLKVWEKSTKSHDTVYTEWVLRKYLNSEVSVDYTAPNGKTMPFALNLIYYPEKNFLEFGGYEFWMGEARFGDKEYPVALYGGLKSGWYLSATFDETPTRQTENQLRIDLNGNRMFEDRTTFDPECSETLQESYSTGEPILVGGKTYEIHSIKSKAQYLLMTITMKSDA